MFFKANFYFLIKEAHKVVFIFDFARSVFADVENEKKEESQLKSQLVQCIIPDCSKNQRLVFKLLPSRKLENILLTIYIMSDYMAILHTTCIRVSLYNVFIIGRSKNTALLLNGILLNDFLKQTVSNKIIHVFFYIFFSLE